MAYKSELTKFIGQLKSKELTSSSAVALASVRLLKKLIGESQWSSSQELLVLLKKEGVNLFQLFSSEMIVKNIWRRVIKIIQDESLNQAQTNFTNFDSLQGNLFVSAENLVTTMSEHELKPIMIEAISEITNEIETSVQNIAAQASDHIHENEVILTLGKSETVQAFLKNAARKRKFHVIVVENEPYLEGHEVASNLSKIGLDVTLIPDSSIFTIISRVNTIIIGTQGIFANGGLKAHVGTLSLALAAKHHNIPLIVCSSLLKLSPEFYADSNNIPDLLPPDDVLSVDFHSNVSVINPSFDYVPPELINLFIFNTTKNAPSYVYRLIREMYSIEDEIEL